MGRGLPGPSEQRTAPGPSPSSSVWAPWGQSQKSTGGRKGKTPCRQRHAGSVCVCGTGDKC